MKHLYLFRHAKSSKNIPDIVDRERPLNQRGLRDLRLVGRRLKKQEIPIDAIYSSPAKRALATAKRVAEEIGFPRRNIVIVKSLYRANIPKLMTAIKHISAAAKTAILFGHNPEFLNLANHLTPRLIVKLPTSGVLGVDFNVNSWKKVARKSGRVVFFDYPKKNKE